MGQHMGLDTQDIDIARVFAVAGREGYGREKQAHAIYNAKSRTQHTAYNANHAQQYTIETTHTTHNAISRTQHTIKNHAHNIQRKSRTAGHNTKPRTAASIQGTRGVKLDKISVEKNGKPGPSNTIHPCPLTSRSR